MNRSLLKLSPVAASLLLACSAATVLVPQMNLFPPRSAAPRLVSSASVQKQPAGKLSEFDKLNLILEKYRGADVKIISGGVEYKSQELWLKARAFLFRERNRIQDADLWIRQYCYRMSGGEILYFQFPDGKLVPVRDIFLAELSGLNQRL